MRPHRRPLSLLLMTACLIGGCSAPAAQDQAGATASPRTDANDGAVASGSEATAGSPAASGGVIDPDDVDPARLDPLAGFGACPAPPEAAPDADPGDLPLPTGAVVTQASTDGALDTAQGFTPRTPVEVMVDYLRLDDWTVLTVEDEVFESEVLLERDGLRVFAKSQAVCERGSAFVLFGSRDPSLVPAPAGGQPGQSVPAP